MNENNNVYRQYCCDSNDSNNPAYKNGLKHIVIAKPLDVLQYASDLAFLFSMINARRVNRVETQKFVSKDGANIFRIETNEYNVLDTVCLFNNGTFNTDPKINEVVTLISEYIDKIKLPIHLTFNENYIECSINNEYVKVFFVINKKVYPPIFSSSFIPAMPNHPGTIPGALGCTSPNHYSNPCIPTPSTIPGALGCTSPNLFYNPQMPMPTTPGTIPGVFPVAGAGWGQNSIYSNIPIFEPKPGFEKKEETSPSNDIIITKLEGGAHVIETALPEERKVLEPMETYDDSLRCMLGRCTRIDNPSQYDIVTYDNEHVTISDLLGNKSDKIINNIKSITVVEKNIDNSKAIILEMLYPRDVGSSNNPGYKLIPDMLKNIDNSSEGEAALAEFEQYLRRGNVRKYAIVFKDLTILESDGIDKYKKENLALSVLNNKESREKILYVRYMLFLRKYHRISFAKEHYGNVLLNLLHNMNRKKKDFYPVITITTDDGNTIFDLSVVKDYVITKPKCISKVTYYNRIDGKLVRYDYENIHGLVKFISTKMKNDDIPDEVVTDKNDTSGEIVNDTSGEIVTDKNDTSDEEVTTE